MLDRGWFEEVAGFVRSSVPDDAKSFDFIECSELRARLEGAVTLTAAAERLIAGHLRFNAAP